MHIRCWGSRGSISVSGKEFLKYGGDTTCMEIRSCEGDCIIIDAGTGIRNLGNVLIQALPKTITMLFTHAHWDHLIGFPFFKPIFNKDATITVYSPVFEFSTPESIFTGLMSRPFFPVQLADSDVRASLSFLKIPSGAFSIGSLTIESIPLSHPKDGGFGYRFTEKGKTFVFLTDNELGHVHNGGCSFEEYRQFCQGVDLLIHDAEYEENEYQQILKNSTERWGHSTVSDVVRLAVEANVKKLGLFHHNASRTDKQLDELTRNARLAMKQRRQKCDCFAVGSSFECEL
ncbi:MAG: MBL fold metallo-hydrolase [Chitinivibrionales bacterium]|nr:MBL fold metallo-hydrolase [Chitinivibrionales bacterium]